MCAIVVGVESPPVAAAAGSTITTIPGSFDGIVPDLGRHVYLGSANPNRIDVLDLDSGTLATPIPLAFKPGAVDLSPDGALLYVVDYEGHSVSVIDLAQRVEIRRLALGVQPDGFAVASNGTALFAAYPTIKQIDLVSGTIRDRGEISVPALGTTIKAQSLHASRDHSRIILFGGAESVYTASTDSFSEPRSFGLASTPVVLDATGSTILLNPGTHVLDRNLDLRGTIPQTDDGWYESLAIDGPGTHGYRGHLATIEVLDITGDRMTATIPLPATPRFGREMTVSADGTTLVVLTDTGIMVVPVSAAIPLPGCTLPAPTPRLVSVCGRLADVAVSADGHAFATNADRDQVDVVSLATGALDGSIRVGSQPRGLDLSPDGRTLYVSDWGSGEVSVVDVALRRELRRIPIPRHPTPKWDGPFSLAVARNGTALLSTSEDGRVGAARFLQIDLVHETVAARPDFDLLVGQTQGPSILKANADHSLITGSGRRNPTSGVVTLYTAATDSITPWTQIFGTGSVAAVAGGPKLLAIPGASVFDLDMVPQADIPGGGKAVAVNPAGTTGYRVQDGSVDVLDLAASVQVAAIALPDAVGAAAATSAVTPDGATLVVITQHGVSVLDAGAVSITPKGAYAAWAQPISAALDAVGTWVVPVNVPVAAAGQLSPSYLYAHYFSFTQSGSALGVIGLVATGGTKLAGFGIVDEAGAAHSVGLPFDWVAGRAYYLFVAQLSPTVFGGWVYDYTAAAWTFVGQVSLPAALGKIASATLTEAVWFGPASGTCSAFPHAEAYFYPPVGYAGGGTTQATMANAGPTAAGSCPATATTELSPWIHLRLGAAPA